MVTRSEFRSEESQVSSVNVQNILRSESRCARIKGIGFVFQRTSESKNWIKQLHTLPVLSFNRCLTTEYSETTAHFNGNFDTDNQFYVP
jgi:hypothetical protein